VAADSSGLLLIKVDTEIGRMAQRILSELETASSLNLSESLYAKKVLLLCDLDHTKGVLLEIRNASPEEKNIIEKRAIIKALLYSTWLQRLYFIIRSSIMGLIGAAITLAVVTLLGTINVFGAIALGVSLFALSLIISRFFDAQVMRATKNIVRHLADHERLRDFIMDHF
jgi:hypothetical protein